MTAFVYALLEIAREEGNTASIEGIRNKAMEKLLGGDVKTLISASLQGKSRSFSVSKAADVLFTEANQAIRLFNNGIITTTTFDNQWI